MLSCLPVIIKSKNINILIRQIEINFRSCDDPASRDVATFFFRDVSEVRDATGSEHGSDVATRRIRDILFFVTGCRAELSSAQLGKKIARESRIWGTQELRR